MWLRDCVSKDPSQTELLLVCSEAAYEAATIERDRMTQAVLQVDCSFVCDEELVDVLSSEQVQHIVAALGVGVMFPDSYGALHADNEARLETQKPRYGKVIVVAELGDAGIKVQNELLGFFQTYLRHVVAWGHVYVLKTPLEPPITRKKILDRALDPAVRSLKAVGGDNGREAPSSGLG